MVDHAWSNLHFLIKNLFKIHVLAVAFRNCHILAGINVIREYVKQNALIFSTVFFNAFIAHKIHALFS